MRFAWLRKNSTDSVPVGQTLTNRLILFVYNLVWWVPIVLPFTRIMSYRTGFILFLAITIMRSAANVYRNNVLSLEQAGVFPLRSP